MPYLSPAAKREYQRRWVAERRKEYLERRGNACEKCGSNNDLEFHHRDRDDKIDHKIWSWSRQRIEEEIAKCDLLCRRCHFGHTVTERGYYNYVHGTHLCYTKTKCRCKDCRRANAEVQKKCPGYKYARQHQRETVSDASSNLATSTI